MKEVIDIYVKVVVAFYGFVGPSFTLLISVFTEGIEKKKAIHEEEVKTIEKIIGDAALPKGKLDTTKLADGLKQLEVQKQKAKKEINLLSPKRQVIRIFIPLTLSLFFISIYHFARTFVCENCYVFEIKLISVLLSFISFAYALYVLWQLFCITIDVKKTERAERVAEKVFPKRKSSPDVKESETVAEKDAIQAKKASADNSSTGSEK